MAGEVKMRINNNQKGRSMVEMMGYIAVVIAITVSIGYIISKAFGDYKYSKASLQVSDLADAITKAGAIEPNYEEIVDMVSGLTDEGKKIIPSSYRINGGNIYHAFGGLVTIEHPNDDVTKFAIIFDNLNRNQCIELAMKDWTHNKYTDLFSITVNNTQWNWPAYGAGDKVLPIKRSEVVGVSVGNDDGICQDAVSNSIMWVFD